ncbi:amino acid transporter, partial [archaeon]|nr:amino acid transporter [archaeon]
TPWIAILITMFVAIIFLFVGEIDLVANITNLFLFLTFAAVNLSLIILRYKAPKMKRAFRCPCNIGKLAVIPLLGLITSLVMMGFILWGFF